MINDRPVYNLPLVNINVYWPIIGPLYCMTSFLLGTICCFAILPPLLRRQIHTQHTYSCGCGALQKRITNGPNFISYKF